MTDSITPHNSTGTIQYNQHTNNNRIQVHLRPIIANNSTIKSAVPNTPINPLITVHDHCTITLNKSNQRSTTNEKSVVHNTIDTYQYKYDYIYDINCTNTQYYNELNQSDCIINNVLYGINQCYITYGQCSSGKSYSLLGNTNTFNYQQRGLIMHIVHALYNKKQSIECESGNQLSIDLQCYEIYNDAVYDLLYSNNAAQQINDNYIVEHNGEILIKTLSTRSNITTELDMLDSIITANSIRHTRSHTLTNHSSRSHLIIVLQCRYTVNELIYVSKLQFIDLAGYERANRYYSSHESNLVMESKSIHRSLSYLEQCINKLNIDIKQNKSMDGFVPYRQCKLTTILKPILNPSSNHTRLTILGHILLSHHTNPDEYFIDESLTACKFLSQCMNNKSSNNIVASNIITNINQQNTRLHNENKQLLTELHHYDTINKRANVSYTGVASDDELNELTQLCQNYIDERIDVIDIVNIRQVHLLFQCMKSLIHKHQSMNISVSHQYNTLQTDHTNSTQQYESRIAELQAELEQNKQLVVQLQQHQLDQDHSKPPAVKPSGLRDKKLNKPKNDSLHTPDTESRTLSRRPSVNKDHTEKEHKEATTESVADLPLSSIDYQQMNENELLSYYYKHDGSTPYHELIQYKLQLKHNKKLLVDTTNQLNQCVPQLDSTPDNDTVKQQYNIYYQQRKQLLNQIDTIQYTIEQLNCSIATNYIQWHNTVVQPVATAVVEQPIDSLQFETTQSLDNNKCIDPAQQIWNQLRRRIIQRMKSQYDSRQIKPETTAAVYRTTGQSTEIV